MARFVLVAAMLFGCAHSASESAQLMPDPLEGVEAERLFRHGLGVAARGDLLRGEQYIVAAIERGYPMADALPHLLDICVRAERYAEALRHAEPFLRSHPDNWALRYVVATLHLALGRTQRARTELIRVTEDAPQAAAPYYTLGTLHRDQLDDEEGAAAHFRRYLELAPDGPHAAEVRFWLDRSQRPSITRLPDHGEPPQGEPAPPPEDDAPEVEGPPGDMS